MALPQFITDPNPDIYLSDNYCVLDLETTNDKYGDARNSNNSIVFGYASSPKGQHFVFRSLDDLLNVGDDWSEFDFIVCQNAKFELKWLHRAGVDISRILVYDTMLGDYVIAGNRGWSLDLDSICHRYEVLTKSNYVHQLIQKGVCPSSISSRAVKEYCMNDVMITEQVMLKQRQKLKEEKLLPAFFIRCLTTPVIAEMEMHGMYLDKELSLKLSKDFNLRYNDIVTQLDEITGGINMASPKQVSDFLYTTLKFPPPKTAYGKPIVGLTGRPKTDEKTLLLLKPNTPKQKEFLELKGHESKLRKKITGYTNRFVDIVKNKDCIMYGNFNQHVVDTHRLSSSNPNLQNIDRALKQVIKARIPGNSIISIDYAGIEFRTGGQLSQDPQVLDDIINKFDVHSYTASIIFNEQWEETGSTKTNSIGEEIRNKAKADTFGPMYGKVRGTDKQIEYFDAFRKKYKVMTDTQESWVQEVLDKGYLTTVTEVKLYYPHTEYTQSGYVTNSTKIKNNPIQMFATADIAPTGVALLWHSMKVNNLKSFLIAEIHDSAVGEIYPDEIEIMNKLATQCMAKDIVPFFKKVYGYELNYPLDVEVKIGQSWR